MVERIPGYCTLCRSRCGSITVVDNGRLVGVENLPGHPTGGALCAKGRAAPEMVHSPRRLTKPLRRTAPRNAAPGWVEISWDEATAARLCLRLTEFYVGDDGTTNRTRRAAFRCLY